MPLLIALNKRSWLMQTKSFPLRLMEKLSLAYVYYISEEIGVSITTALKYAYPRLVEQLRLLLGNQSCKKDYW